MNNLSFVWMMPDVPPIFRVPEPDSPLTVSWLCARQTFVAGLLNNKEFLCLAFALLLPFLPLALLQ